MGKITSQSVGDNFRGNPLNFAENVRKYALPISRCMWYSGISNGTDVDVTYRTKHEILADCFNIRLLYGNFHTDDDPARLSALSDITLNVTLETLDNKIHNITFGGKKTATIQAGGKVLSDPIGLEFIKGQTFYIRQHVVVPASGKFPTGITGLVANGEGKMSGDITTGAFSTSSDVYCYAPYAIYATPSYLNSDFKSVASIGDSISVGVGHTNVSVDGHIAGNNGFIQFASMRMGYGYVSLGMNGQRTDGFVQYKRLNRMNVAKDCDIAVVEYGTNDLEAKISLQTIKDNLLDIWKSLAIRGIKVYQTTIVPRTNSTDSWVTETNQTPTQTTTAGGSGTDRTLLNDWIRSKPSIYLAGVVDVAKVCETYRNSGIWIPNMTSDGIHPNNVCHYNMSNELYNTLKRG